MSTAAERPRAVRLTGTTLRQQRRAESNSRASTPAAQALTQTPTAKQQEPGSKGKQPAKAKPKRICPDPSCKSEDVFEHEGQLVCTVCGTVVESANIVSDVTFGETATGQAVVQGSHIGDGQRFAHTMGSGAPRGAMGPSNSREMSLKAGREEIYRLADALGIAGHRDHAVGLYGLASTNSFTQGRNVRAVAAICLYFCCRTRDPDNKVLLMDFAERIKYNVFRLGNVYKEFCNKMYLNPNAIDKDHAPDKIPQVEIEPLVRRFCRRLEFGTYTSRVAEDACKILSRFDRDWMVSGRRPAGLVGACIILAARMNNYRRSVREIVYIVRATDQTVAKRLEEWKRTRSARMTVDQFRNGGHALAFEHDPPSMQNSKERLEKLEEKRKRKRAALDNASEAPESSTPRPTIQEVRRDADGFVIPALPIDPNLMRASASPSVEPEDDGEDAEDAELQPPPRKRRKKETLAPIEIHQTDLRFERTLSKQIEGILHDRIELDEYSFEAARRRAEEQAEAHRTRERTLRQANGAAVALAPDEIDNTDAIGDLDEFADDPEVNHCLLSEPEQKVKEAIWLTHNEDWLRAEQKRILDRTLEEARTGGAKKTPGKGKKQGGKGRKKVGATPGRTASEAVAEMLEKRNPHYSRNINYDRMKEIYDADGNDITTSSGGDDSGGSSGDKDREASVETGISMSGSEVGEGSGMDQAEAKKPKRRASVTSGGRASQERARPDPSPAKPIDISDDEEDEDQDMEEEDDDEVRSALESIGDSVSAIGYGTYGDDSDDGWGEEV
ncbi:hypothetical protein NA57DRAFT_77212 [Rhizodiscina lignyota]|uniref:Cyclin-like domain-containing protein n=1 Tax=Rhizodiscina lignyota TaxID=1504668 RepID=A0A9P4IEB1_9PEZI|nr:hypothetical protein NA57DRAFT_77212 [Rhizodiscina lignyota]